MRPIQAQARHGDFDAPILKKVIFSSCLKKILQPSVDHHCGLRNAPKDASIEIVNIAGLAELTGMPQLVASELLRADPKLMSPTREQWILESAIFDRLGTIAYGHTPGSTEHAIRQVEPGRRAIVIHPGPELDITKLAASLTPQFEDGNLQNGIPALRSGPSNRGTVLFRKGIDAAVILAGVPHSAWTDAIKSLETGKAESFYLEGGRVTAEESAWVPVEAGYRTRYGSILLRRIKVTYALPHMGIHIYRKSPGLVLEIFQHQQCDEAEYWLFRAMEQAGLELARYKISPGEITLTFQHQDEEGPLLVRLAQRPLGFPG